MPEEPGIVNNVTRNGLQKFDLTTLKGSSDE